MANLDIHDSTEQLAAAAAAQAVQVLDEAISQHGAAVWVLAGGTAPLQAYRVLARDYRDALAWENVYVLLGDERCVPVGSPDSSWEQIEDVLLDNVSIPEDHRLRPSYELSAETAAAAYAQVIASLPRFDLIWLGIGEDGHTLSLFPGQPTLQSTDLVVPVHDSPKPPPDRVSLGLRALERVQTAMVLAVGAGKADAVVGARAKDSNLPIVQAVTTIEAAGGTVTWMVDRAANGQ